MKLKFKKTKKGRKGKNRKGSAEPFHVLPTLIRLMVTKVPIESWWLFVVCVIILTIALILLKN